MRGPASVGTFLLGMSAVQRAAYALGIAAVLWVCVWWAL
jgi:hypothetical protein